MQSPIQSGKAAGTSKIKSPTAAAPSLQSSNCFFLSVGQSKWCPSFHDLCKAVQSTVAVSQWAANVATTFSMEITTLLSPDRRVSVYNNLKLFVAVFRIG